MPGRQRGLRGRLEEDRAKAAKPGAGDGRWEEALIRVVAACRPIACHCLATRNSTAATPASLAHRDDLRLWPGSESRGPTATVARP